jgi:flagellar protein FlaG
MSLVTESVQAASYIAPAAVAFGSQPQQAKPEVAQAVQEKPEQKKVSMEEIQKAVDDVNQNLSGMHTELSFSVDKESGKMVLRIVDSETKEVIRQIPHEDALRLASRITTLLGLFVDENA